jgi:hypothetical protein
MRMHHIVSVCLYPAWNAHAPYFHLRSASYLVFSTLSHKRHYFRNKFTAQKMCFGFSRNVVKNISHSKKKWERYDKIVYRSSHEEPVSTSDYNETGIFLPGVKNTQLQLLWKSVHWEQIRCMRTERCTEMTKLIVANAPNNSYSPSVRPILCSCNTFVCAADSNCFFTVTGLWYWVANWYKCCNWRGFV